MKKQIAFFQINHGGDIPEEYYLTHISEAKKEEMKKVVVGARRTHRVVCEAPQPQSVLKWEFFTTEYDIAYGVHHYNSRTPKDDLVCLLNKCSVVIWSSETVGACWEGFSSMPVNDGPYLMLGTFCYLCLRYLWNGETAILYLRLALSIVKTMENVS